MTDDMELYARIAMVEYILEVMMANELARQPQEASDNFKVALLEKKPRPAPGANLSSETERTYAEALTRAMGRFFDRLDEREQQIRARRSQLPGQ